MAEHVSSMDPPRHTRTRGLLSRLLTPKRLRENEEYISRLVDEKLDSFVADGRCEFLESYGKPLSMLVIADLLGVPEEDHDEFNAVLATSVVGGDAVAALNPLQFLDDKFNQYITDRRQRPREDVLTELARRSTRTVGSLTSTRWSSWPLSCSRLGRRPLRNFCLRRYETSESFPTFRDDCGPTGR